MDNVKQRLQDISEIRSMMEHSTRFLSLSGLSGVSAGIIALIGAGVAWYFLGAELHYARHFSPRSGLSFFTFFFWDAGLVLFFALIFACFFSWRKAKKLNLPIWNKTAQRVLISMMIPLSTGAIFAFIQLSYGIYYWVAATTLLFYGMALLNASKYTLREIRYLGITQIIIGLMCAYWAGYGLYFWAIGFGIAHIVYGIMMYIKYER